MSFFNKQDRLNKRLFDAVRKGKDLNSFKSIIDKGGDVHHLESEQNILFSITGETSVKVVEYIVKQGVDANSLGKISEELPVMRAIGIASEDVYSFLLEKTKDLNSRNSMGSSVIMYAVYHSRLGLVEKLLDRNVDLSFKTDHGKDVFELCKNYRVEELLAPYKPEQKEIKNLEAGWHIVSKDEIAYIHLLKPLSREVTEIFNFASERKMKIVRNLQTNAESHSECDLFAVESSSEILKLEEAASRLHKNDSTVDLTGFKNRSYKMIDGKATRKMNVQIYK